MTKVHCSPAYRDCAAAVNADLTSAAGRSTVKSLESFHAMWRRPMGQRRLPPLAYGGYRPEQHHLNEALWLKEHGRYDDAEVKLTRFTEAYPKLADGWRELAMVRLIRGRIPEARNAAEHAAAIDPSTVIALIEVGVGAHATGNTVEAARALTAAIDREPLEPIANHYLGCTLAASAPDAAAIAFARALAGSTRPEYAEASVSSIDVQQISTWTIFRLAALPRLAACVEEPIRTIVDAAGAIAGGQPGAATALLADLQAFGQPPWDAAAIAMLRYIFRSRRLKRLH